MSLAKRIASSTLSQVFSKFAIAALSIISVKLITGYLGVKGYGEYTVIYEMMSFSGIVADFGFFHIALKEMSKDKENMPKILGNILSLRMLLALLAGLVNAGLVFGFTDYSLDTVKLGLVIALGTSAIGLMGTTITAVIQVHLKMAYAAFVQIIGKCAQIGYLWWAIQNDMGFLHMLFAGFFATIVTLTLTYLYTIRFSPISFQFDFPLWKKLFYQTYPMGLALIFYSMALRSPILILDGIVKDSALTGMYGVAQRITEVLIFIPIAFMNSVLPSISRLVDEKTEQAKEQLTKIIQYSFDCLNALSLPLIAGCIVLAPQIITIISKDDFAQNYSIFQILVGMIFFYYLSTLFGYVLLAYDQQKLYMVSNFWSAVSAIVFGLTITTYAAHYGALSAHIIGEVVSMGLSYWFLKDILHQKISFHYFYRMLAATLMMFGVLIACEYLFAGMSSLKILLLLTPIGAIVYGSSLLLFGALPLQELRDLLTKSKVKTPEELTF